MRLIIVLLGVQLLMLASSASAVIITTDTVQVAGTEYTTEFTVDNSSGTIPIEWFTIFFEADKYSNLTSISEPLSGWDPIVAPAGLGEPGFVDYFALTASIGLGETLSGFVVGYSLVPGASIGPWDFHVLDPDSFDIPPTILLSGATAISAVPEPSVILLLAGGLMSMGLIRRRKYILEPARHLDEGRLSVDRKHGGVA